MKKIVGEVKMQMEQDNKEKALDEKVKAGREERTCSLGLLPCILSSSWCKEVWRESAETQLLSSIFLSHRVQICVKAFKPVSTTEEKPHCSVLHFARSTGF